MGLSVTTTIFLFVICLCGGIAIGAIFSRAKKLPTPPPTTEEEKSEVQPEAIQPPTSLAQDGDLELLRAWRNHSGKVWLEMDGQRLENKDAMQPEQKKRLLDLVLELRPWLNIPPSSSPAPVPPPRQPSQTPSAVASSANARPVVTTTSSPRPLASLKSIVEQIDDVLQKKLAGTIFAEQDIHLLDGPGGAVLAKVGHDTFEGIDAVTNPEIKGLIKLAVAEWEKGAK